MHFWIDKRSQCAYSGRHRVPTSLSSGVGRPRGRVGVGVRKGMAAPVHRFTSIECAPRRLHRPHRYNSTQQVPAVHSSARRVADEPSLYVEIPLDPPQPTIASLAAARSVTPDTLLRTAALGLHHSPVMAPHLKFGMLVSFALATVFLVGAKYYFDRQVMRDGNSGGEASVVCAAVAALAGVGCALSLCRDRPPPPIFPPDRVSSTAQRPPVPDPSDDISLGSMGQTVDRAPSGPSTSSSTEDAPPPPYHIAVLLPGRGRESPSPPPPAYSALS